MFNKWQVIIDATAEKMIIIWVDVITGGKQMENRKSGIQPTETLAGKYRACMQLEWKGTEESLSDGADIRRYPVVK